MCTKMQRQQKKLQKFRYCFHPHQLSLAVSVTTYFVFERIENWTEKKTKTLKIKTKNRRTRKFVHNIFPMVSSFCFLFMEHEKKTRFFLSLFPLNLFFIFFYYLFDQYVHKKCIKVHLFFYSVFFLFLFCEIKLSNSHNV